MALSIKRKEKLKESNRQEYGDTYAQLFFPDAPALRAAAERRQELLQELAERSATGCYGTKLDMNNLSPGCQICVAGQWSCLFINGKCNGNCFYCPTSQNEVGQPSTNTVIFPEPKEYVAYLRHFGFQGASISGGEPLLTLDKSVSFIRSIKKHFGEKIHVWLYTNGILATREVMQRLADAGLNEIRFDIGATGYSLRQIEHAVGIIRTVTVEIPAIPEERERLKNLLPSLHDTGVQHLNLHQLRLTPYNLPKLVARGYQLLHGEKVTVLDSELTALELLWHGKQNNIKLPINYCSFTYKNRFQSLAARRRNSLFIQKSYETLTENGFVRNLLLTGSQDVLARHILAFDEQGYDNALWKLAGPEKLYIHTDLLPKIDFETLSLQISYSAAFQRQSAGYHNPFTKVALTKAKNIVIERETYPTRFCLSPDQARAVAALIAAVDAPESLQQQVELPEELLDFEYIRAGFTEYF